MSTEVVAVLIGLSLWLVAVTHWRRGLAIVFVMVVVEGAIRKWGLPGAQTYVYLAKDFLLLGALLGFLMDRVAMDLRSIPRSIRILCSLYMFIAVAQAFNLALPNLALGLFGVKTHLLYLVFLILIPLCFSTEDHAVKWLKRYCYICLPVILLAAVQVGSGANSALNTYVGAAQEDVVTFGYAGHVRVTGTFSYISGFTAFSYFMSCLCLGLLAADNWRIRGNLLVITSLVACWAGFFMSGSRGPVVLWVAMTPVLLFMVRRYMSVRFALTVLLGWGLAAIVAAYGMKEVFQAFLQRAESSGGTLERLAYVVATPFEVWADAGLFGYGSGATHQASSALVPGLASTTWLPENFEGEPERIAIELGIVGQLVVYAIRALLVVAAWQSLIRATTSVQRGLALFAFVYLGTSFLGQVVFNATAGLYYWLTAGVVVWLRRVQRNDTNQAKPAANYRRPPRPATFGAAGRVVE